MSFNRIILIATHIVSDLEYIAENILLLKNGKLIHYGKPNELVKELQNKVYMVSIPTKEIEYYLSSYKVVNVTGNGNQATLRIISNDPPKAKQAMHIKPCLEDIYLYYFDETSACNIGVNNA